jgi:MFS family permease
VGPVLAVTTATQALSTLGILALAAAAPRAAADLGVSAAVIGYQVAVVYLGAATLSLAAGGVVRRYGPVRTSQIALALVGGGCALSATGVLLLVVAGAFIMGLGYGATNPAASQLLARVAARRMNLIFSLKQTGVPIGGVLSGVIVPPLTVWAGWQVALAVCAGMILALCAAVGVVRGAWDTERSAGAPILASAPQSFGVVVRNPILRWLASASFLYSGVQLCLTGFLLTYLVSDVGLGLVAAGTILSVTHASGALGRIAWGVLADRFRSGGAILVANGVMTIVGLLLVSAIDPGWPMPFVVAACVFFGFSALGWNGVYIAAIARRAPAGTIGLATGGSLFVTYAGVIVTPPAFAALHDRLDTTYGMAFALLSVVSAVGIACVAMAWRARIRADAT